MRVRKGLVLFFSAVLLSITFASTANAAVLASVTQSKTGGTDVYFTGNGKYMRFYCSYSGSFTDMTSDGDCSIYKFTSSNTIESVTDLLVGGNTKKSSTYIDVWLDKNSQYGMKADLGLYPPSNASTTATITDLP
ncbi:hypothetical protein SRCM101294_01110 [Bacillus amyloliquefaciens]|uniref:hypothetical protein n=1 Tax=Bacillus amyloliquefaciens TaxID=1390 RepID=UPI00080C4FB6|nr:hypothetical protein [Bacillus amyloliquefaciens]OCB96923.1 hypothetical protein SRCM101294_01110 [Bacillus amyloliquefaciens]